MRLESAWAVVMRWRSLRLKPKAAAAPITGRGAFFAEGADLPAARLNLI